MVVNWNKPLGIKELIIYMSSVNDQNHYVQLANAKILEAVTRGVL